MSCEPCSCADPLETCSFLGIFSWQFLPAVIFPTLTSIATLCLINNQSLVMRILGSGYDGFGLLDFVRSRALARLRQKP